MKPSIAKKLLKLNYDLYEHQARSFSDTRKEMWEKEILDFVSEIPTGSSVLDLGCGNGRLLPQLINVKLKTQSLKQQFKSKNHSLVLQNIGIDYLGIDPSKTLIKQNQKKYGRGLFRVGDGLKLKLKNKFDYIISIAVLHHIPSEELQLKFLKNIHQALKPKGKVLISVWNRWQPRYKKYFMFENSKSEARNPKQVRNYNDKNSNSIVMKQCNNVFNPINFHDLSQRDTIVPWRQSGYFRYIHAFKPSELKFLAQKAGFKKIQCFSSKHGVKVNLKEALNIYLIGTKR